MTIRLTALLGAATLALALPAAAQAQDRTAAPAEQDWVARSNAYTNQLLLAEAQFNPEGASQNGLEQFDGLVRDMGPDLTRRTIAAEQAQGDKFRAALASETDPRIRQDLQILINSTDQSIAGAKLNDRLLLTWVNVPAMIFGSFNGILTDQTSPARREKAKEMLERYVGSYPGTTAMTELGKARWAESQGPGKVGPYKGSVEDAVSKTDAMVSGIRTLFAKYKIKGADKSLDKLEKQFRDYEAWERSTVLPAARDDFRLPSEIYAFRLKQVGIDIPPEQLVARARRGFYETRAEMEALAPQVAAKFGFEKTDYPSVIAELKKQSVPADELEKYYAGVMAQIDDIIRKEKIVSVPDFPVLMRLGTEAENAASPAPHMSPPRLIGNTGERGTFVLTTGNPAAGPGERYDDFNYPAAAWFVASHEARPGHELQFAQMVERGVSQARALYALNSVNVEGWALYAEGEMMPYLPVEGQLGVLQSRLLRTARAMLDPMLNLGQIDIESARHVLEDEARFSKAFAKQELDRYTFRSPGQAGSYYYGYSQLIDLRIETELALGDRFDQQAYNDFLIGEGALPIGQLAQAVRTDFVPRMKAK